MVEQTDQELLTLIREPASLEKGYRLLMQKYQEKLYWHIRRMVGNHDDTDDILQNTFIKAFKNINSFEERSSLYTWLYRIATNETISHQKSAHSRHIVAMSDYTTLPEKTTEDFDNEAVEQKLNKAIQDLPEKQRTVFNMRYFDELSYQEMSDLLATSVGALKASYHIAAKKIEAVLIA
jgi:RNA polymerase sigma factor (sigma-70 family)